MNPAPKFRVANFSSLSINEENVLSFGHNSSVEIIKTLRKHVDLPYVYVVSAGQENLVMELLAELKAIRSTCFPYVLFVVDGNYSAIDEVDLDVIHLESSVPEDISPSGLGLDAKENRVFFSTRLGDDLSAIYSLDFKTGKRVLPHNFITEDSNRIGHVHLSFIVACHHS